MPYSCCCTNEQFGLGIFMTDRLNGIAAFFNGIASLGLSGCRKTCNMRLCLFNLIEFVDNGPWDASSHSLNFHIVDLKYYTRLCIRGLLLNIWHSQPLSPYVPSLIQLLLPLWP